MTMPTCIANIRRGDLLYYGDDYGNRVLVAEGAPRGDRMVQIAARQIREGKPSMYQSRYDVIVDGRVVVNRIIKASQ